MKLNEAINVPLTESQRTNQFMDEYYELTDDHPFDRYARIYNGVSLEVRPAFNQIHISDITSTQPQTGRGKMAMQFLMGLANKHRVKLDLSAKPYSNNPKHITELESLVQWYMRLGFLITDDLVNSPNELEGLEEVEMTYFPR